MKSYYQGSTISDIRSFLQMCREEQDPKREERRKAFEKCIPFFDGQCGMRVKEDIIYDLKNSIL
ncbi:MAG: hypothetical protein LIO96_00275 [Lachnospiraceae bacterium]|nr:hypothetical protein [Lachnospiraceae bacterium]